MITSEKVQKFWDKQAKRYDSGEKRFASVYEEIIAKTSKYLKQHDYVLDYGCATGTKTLELAKKVQHIHGLDISQEMINEAIKKKDRSEILNVSFSRGTIFNSDMEKASFDIIIAYGILHLLEDYEEVIRRIHELLKPGGLFISTTACMKDKMAFKQRLEITAYIYLKKLDIFPLHLNIFMSADVEKLIADHNFEIDEAEKIVYGIPAIFIAARKR